MSLSRLSTESDVQIARALSGDIKSLSALSKVSKYYRSVVEPHLYAGLSFHNTEGYALWLLLLTLVSRPDLCLYISKFSLTPGGKSPPLPTDAETMFGERLWAGSDEIRGQMQGLILPAHSLYAQGLKRYIQILKTNVAETNVAETDGPLALVLYMAVNIREFHIAYQGQMCVIRTLMGADCSCREDLPFQKLEVFEISGAPATNLAVAILPSLTSLKVSSDYDDYTTLDIDSSGPHEQCFITPAPLPACPSLSRLELFNIGNIDAIDVAAMVASPWLANLRDLSVYSCYKRRSGLVRPNIMSNLLRALECNIPLLESFEWTRHDPYGPDFGQFDNFRGLKNLRSLMVDFHLLVPPFDSTLEVLDVPHMLFPASLRNLILDNFTVAKVHSLVSKFHRASGDVGNLGEAVSNALKYLAAKLEPLQQLTLGIDMEGNYDRVSNKVPVIELEAEDVVFFRYAADELVKTGLTLRVERMPGFYDRNYKALVEPGYTAPLPHSVTPDDGDSM